MSRSRSRSAGREMAEVSGESKASGDFWRLQLEAVYARRNPAKLGKIPELLQKYAGQEAVLYAKVCRTYDLNPQKFHTEPDAWLEYDLPDRGTYIREADSTEEEQFEVSVSLVSGASCTLAVQPSTSVDALLRRACRQLQAPASTLWMGKLIKAEAGDGQALCRQWSLARAQVQPNSTLTLAQGVCPEMELAERAFEAMSAQGGTGDVYIAHVLEKAEREQEVILLGAFKSRRDAARALVDRAKHEFAQAMQRAYEDDSYQEPTFLLEGANFSLLVEDAMLQQFKVTGVPLA